MAKQPTPPAVGPDIGGATASPAVALTAACVSAQNTGPLEIFGNSEYLAVWYGGPLVFGSFIRCGEG